jgi:hypothetical protein
MVFERRKSTGQLYAEHFMSGDIPFMSAISPVPSGLFSFKSAAKAIKKGAISLFSSLILSHPTVGDIEKYICELTYTESKA